MEKTYSVAGFIGKDFLERMFWFPSISQSFHESVHNFSPPVFSLRSCLVSEWGEKKNNLKIYSRTIVFFCVVS